MEKKIIIYCDGGSRGNPGAAASAFVVTRDEKEIAAGSKFFKKETNNFAEYVSVLLGIKWIVANKSLVNGKEIIFNLDSQLVERQLNGLYKIKNERLKKHYDEIKSLMEKNNLKINFVWGYRHKNKLADTLVNKTLDITLEREKEIFYTS